ncbi:rod shape-determining protein RodA [Murdochiella vaginalis]|uniref:rod shape-determining protein RodA n=1 Tax=Murdochiella vaginalis TaxID=1852373 RepID=UPI0008FE0869|nr:rod shape-determining protein RodA [Murdochiella vaginalis]
MFNRSKKDFSKFDWLLSLAVLALCLVGFVVVFSATASRGGQWHALKSQFAATALGLAFIIAFQFVDSDFLKKLAFPAYGVAVLLLLATMLFGIGEDAWGARSWLKLGPISFQPAEFTKIAIMMSLALLLERYHYRMNKITTLLLIAGIIGFPILLILKQPDFGTAAVFLFFIALMVYYAQIHWGYILAAVVFVIIAAPVFYQHLSPMQQDRILNFLNPMRDIMNSGYQTYQGLIAIGSGKLFGKGFLQGTQTQFGFIPERDTDFIFAVLAEEFGFIGCLILLVLYAVVLVRILFIAKKAKDLFSRSLCIGVASMLFIHIFENIGMTVGLMPLTGIPLPFLSNGGTFQLINMVSIGLVLCISTQRVPLDFAAEPPSSLPLLPR